jgi:ABC-type dipeptide/oligopeptide/nickel transport system permease component
MSPAQVEHVREVFHFDDPIYLQYFYWVGGILHGDWGYSKTNGNMPVTDTIATFFPATLELTIVGLAIALLIGIPLGTMSAVRRGKFADHGSRLVALIGVSLPIFILGLLLQSVFYADLHLLPATGRYDEYLFMDHSAGYTQYTGLRLIDTLLNGNLVLFGDALAHILMPAIVLSFGCIALLARMMRSSMLEVLDLDYVRMAKAKGLPQRMVIEHARRNALLPVTTMTGLIFASMLGGAVLNESIFMWPGLGYWSTKAIINNDSVSIMGFVLFSALLFVLINLIVDILYAYLDPRIKLG